MSRVKNELNNLIKYLDRTAEEYSDLEAKEKEPHTKQIYKAICQRLCEAEFALQDAVCLLNGIE